VTRLSFAAKRAGMSPEQACAERVYAAYVPDDSGGIEQPDVLSIGSVVGGVGAAARAWDEPLKDFTLRVTEARVGVESPLKLNVFASRRSRTRSPRPPESAQLRSEALEADKLRTGASRGPCLETHDEPDLERLR
jgi:hypothetical protein